MAGTVRIDKQRKDRAVADLKTKADDAWNYITGDLSNLVKNFSSWWIGDAYETFKKDFETTKQKFKTDIYEEILAYRTNLDKAVIAQGDQDTSNARKISIN